MYSICPEAVVVENKAKRAVETLNKRGESDFLKFMWGPSLSKTG
jgi:hypothetical protein